MCVYLLYTVHCAGTLTWPPSSRSTKMYYNITTVYLLPGRTFCIPAYNIIYIKKKPSRNRKKYFTY